MDRRIETITNACGYISTIIEGLAPEIGIVLGSGLGRLADKITDKIEIPYKDIPDFPISTAIGHEGKFILGHLGGKQVIAMKGRIHYYEGYDMATLTLPVRVMSKLGVQFLLVSNAAGALNPEYKVGDPIIIKDHINFMANPLIGANMDDFGPRFPDMTCAFSTPAITGFMEDCPYEGEDALMVGDVFYKINGERIYFSSDVSTYLARRTGDTSDIMVIRDGKKLTLEDYPMVQREYVDEATGQTVMRYGITFGVKEEGALARLKYSWYCAKDFVRMVRLGLTDLVTGAVGLKQMSGVVGIVDMIADVGTSSDTVGDALWNIAYLTAFIAINLAVMNLLPLPALDGGRVFFLLVSWLLEHLLRRKIAPKYEAYINTAGLVALLGLMVYVMYNDIARIIAG